MSTTGAPLNLPLYPDKYKGWGQGMRVALTALNAAIASLQANTGFRPFSEIPTGSVDGSNAAFTLSHAPIGWLVLSYNGLVMQAGGVDYTVSGTNITFTQAPAIGGILQAFYFY